MCFLSVPLPMHIPSPLSNRPIILDSRRSGSTLLLLSLRRALEYRHSTSARTASIYDLTEPRGRIATYGREGISNALDNLLLVFLLSCLFSPLLPYCPLFFLMFLSFLHSNLDVLLHVAFSVPECCNPISIFQLLSLYIYSFYVHRYILTYISTCNIITVNIF